MKHDMMTQHEAPRGVSTFQDRRRRAAVRDQAGFVRRALSHTAFVVAMAALQGASADAATLNVPGTYATIQAAIAAAANGDTISVAAGTYTEAGQIVISKNLSIVGAGMGSTIIKPSADTGTTADARGWFLVNTGKTFNLQNVTLDGTGVKIYQAIRHKGNGTISNCAFTNIQYEQSGPAYEGTAVGIHSTGHVNLTNCTFTGIGRIGIAVYDTYWPLPSPAPTGTFNGNTYTGKGAGNWVDYAFVIQAGAQVVISNNTISNCLGVATVDGSISGAIVVWDDPGTTAAITGNTLTNNTSGVAIAVWNGGTNYPHVNIGDGNTFNGGGIGVDFENVGLMDGNPDYVSGGAPWVTFGASIFKAQSEYALRLDDDIAVGRTYNISAVIFEDAGGQVITDPAIIKSLIYDDSNAPNRGAFVTTQNRNVPVFSALTAKLILIMTLVAVGARRLL